MSTRFKPIKRRAWLTPPVQARERLSGHPFQPEQAARTTCIPLAFKLNTQNLGGRFESNRIESNHTKSEQGGARAAVTGAAPAEGDGARVGETRQAGGPRDRRAERGRAPRDAAETPAAAGLPGFLFIRHAGMHAGTGVWRRRARGVR